MPIMFSKVKKKKEDYEENFTDFYFPPDHILVHWSKDEHIVILKGRKYFYEIDWKTTDELDEKIREKNWENCKNEIFNAAQRIEALILPDWPLHRVKSIKLLLGTAIFNCLSFDEKNAKQMIAEAQSLMNTYRKDIIRYWTLLYSSISFVIFIVLNFTLLFFHNFIDNQLKINSTPYVLALLFGNTGSFFSICLRIGNVNYYGKTGSDIIVLETLCRICIGGISGLLMFLLVKAGIILPILQNAENTIVISLILAFIAGSSERLIPSIIAHVEKSYSKGEQADEPK